MRTNWTNQSEVSTTVSNQVLPSRISSVNEVGTEVLGRYFNVSSSRTAFELC
jgi:hypothetical protein